MKFFICLSFIFFLTISAEETLLVKQEYSSTKFVISDLSNCSVKSYYKIPRSSFWAVKTDNADNSIKCLGNFKEIKSVFKDTPVNIEYKSGKTDPYIQNQWHLQNTGQAGIAGEDASILEAWEYIRKMGLEPGKGIKIGIIDDAFDLHHPDMEGKFLHGEDVIDKDGYPFIKENEPHGTCVSGVIAAVSNNGIGVAGACPECKIVPVRASDKLGQSENMAVAFNYLLDRGVQVISNSWGPSDGIGGVEMPEVIQEIINYARTEERGGKGVVVLFASGNGNESISDPETFDGFAANSDVFAIGAVNASGIRSSYSDFGKDLDFLSPSSDVDAGYAWDPYAVDMTKDGIWTIDSRSYYGYFQTDYTASFGGTSSATPLASAVVGLLISVYPDITWDGIYDILKRSSDKVSLIDAKYNESGFSEYYGYGRINALEALKLLCTENNCAGGLENVDEDAYPAYGLDLELNGDADTEYDDESMLPDKKKTDGCTIIIF